MFSSLRKHRNFRLFFVGQIVSLSGTWAGDTALPWLVIERTRSPIAVGLLLFCRYAPFTLFGLLAGVVADRFDNRRFLILTQTASMIVAGALAVMTLTPFQPLWAIYLLAVLGGTAVVFDAPSRNAFIFQLVGREELPDAVALNAGLSNAARVVGPALGGIVIAAAGVSVCFAMNAVSFVAVLAVLVLIRPTELARLERSETALRWGAAIKEGIGYARHDPLLRLVLAVTAFVSLMGFNLRTLLPVLASNTLDVGAAAFGALYACFGAGALVGAVLAAGVSSPSGTRFVAGVVAFSMPLIVISPLHTAWLIGVFLFVLGVGFSVWVAASQAILQLRAPDRLRGRIVSLWIFAFAGLTPVGSLLAAWLATVGGTALAFSVAGGSGLIVAAVGVAALRGMDVEPFAARPVQLAGELPLP